MATEIILKSQCSHIHPITNFSVAECCSDYKCEKNHEDRSIKKLTRFVFRLKVEICKNTSENVLFSQLEASGL